MEQLTEEQQKQVKKMSTARIRQRLIKAGFTVCVYIRFIRKKNIGRQTATRIHEQKA